jgi:Phosphotransferase enzyme family
MQGKIDDLASVIAAHLREWDPSPAFVELAIYASDDAVTIAQAIDRFCLRHLGAPVAKGLFYQSSIGSVTGVTLDDGRSVVIKAHQPERSHQFLVEIVRIQSYLSDRGVLATRVLAGPLPLGQGLAIMEQFADIGVKADADRPEIRRALAKGLHTIVRTCEPLVETTTLGPGLAAAAGEALWPTPHSKLFDFAATSRGAEWIDQIAALARKRMAPAGRRVIGHGDWRQEHVHFVGDGPVVAFDWDSLCCEHEPALLGAAAHGFRADWSCSGRRQAPTLDEARAFKRDYEAARGEEFSTDERRLCGASFAYACAYSARCSHTGADGDAREQPGTFQNLLWSERANLLDL